MIMRGFFLWTREGFPLTLLRLHYWGMSSGLNVMVFYYYAWIIATLLILMLPCIVIINDNNSSGCRLLHGQDACPFPGLPRVLRTTFPEGKCDCSHAAHTTLLETQEGYRVHPWTHCSEVQRPGWKQRSTGHSVPTTMALPLWEGGSVLEITYKSDIITLIRKLMSKLEITKGKMGPQRTGR